MVVCELGKNDVAYPPNSSACGQKNLRDTRAAYVVRFGKEAVDRAVTKAGRHRARARGYGLEDHFSSWEWLELLNRLAFKCPVCKTAVDLEPHHGLPLSRGGTNLIGNILPLCYTCHVNVHEQGVRFGEEWRDRQMALTRTYRPGDWVRYYRYSWMHAGNLDQVPDSQWSLGEITSVLEPERLPLEELTRCFAEVRGNTRIVKSNPLCESGLFLEGGEAVYMSGACAIIRDSADRASQRSTGRERPISLASVRPPNVDMDTWFQEQQRLYVMFSEGMMISRGERLLPGVVVRVHAPQKRIGLEGRHRIQAKADVYHSPGGKAIGNGSPGVVTVPLELLRRGNEQDWLNEQRMVCSQLSVGDTVRRRSGAKRKRGIILSLTPPEICPPWHDFAGDSRFDPRTVWVPWKEAQVHVRWVLDGKATDSTHDVKGVVRLPET